MQDMYKKIKYVFFSASYLQTGINVILFAKYNLEIMLSKILTT